MNVNYVTNLLVKKDSYETTAQSMKQDSGIFVLVDESSNTTTKYIVTIKLAPNKSFRALQGLVIYVNCAYWHDLPSDEVDFYVHSVLNVLRAICFTGMTYMQAGTLASPC